MPFADIVFAGLREAAIATGIDGPPDRCARVLQEMGARTAVVTLGSLGALARQGEVVHRAPARAVTAVDTVGAGDAFVAGYLAEAWAGAGVEQCLATGNAAGAFACTVPGDWEGAPGRAQLELLTADDPVIR
nr:PfkB family carbohydrate kinase [Nakamurella flavida]